MKKVTVYSSDTCPYCHMAMDYLKEHNVEFEEKNITADPEARRFLIKNKIMGVPVIYVDDQMITGFDKDKINELLDL